MSDIEMVIKIPEEAKKAFDRAESNELKGGYYDHGGVIGKAIKNGTPLPKGHGRLIDADALFDYFGNDALDEVTRSNIEYFINETNGIIIKADKAESEET